MPQKIINFSSQLLKKILFIFIVLLGFSAKESTAQSMSARDSLEYKIKRKRIADSTRIALRKIAVKKRQDSLQLVIKSRQAERIRRADSTREARLKLRQAERKRNKEYQLRKKNRQEIRDSVAAASKKAAAARKAYIKKQKKKKKATSTQAKKVIVKKNTSSKKKGKPKDEISENKTAKKKTKPRKKRRKEIPIVTKNKREKKVKTITPKKKKVVTKKIIEEPKKGRISKKKIKHQKPKKEKSKSTKAQSKELKKELVQTKKRKSDKKEVQTKEKKNGSIKPSKPKKQRIASIYPEEKIVPQFFKREKIITVPDKKNTYFSFQFGQSNYLGDLGGGTRVNRTKLGDLDFKENTFFYGFSLSQIRKEAIGIRLSYVFGNIAGSDKNTFYQDEQDPAYSRFVRNLDFRSTISEGSLLFEIYPFKFISYQKKLHNSYFQPYALFGVGRYSFNPQGSYFDPILDENVWVDLQPLALEGQGMAEHPDRMPYKTSQWNLPLGLGLRYEISRTIGLSVEYVGRVLSTDYLDDVSTNYIEPELFEKYLNADDAELAKFLNNKSRLVDANRAYSPGQQRGDPERNDFYFSIVAKLSIKINRDKRKKKSPRFKSFKYDDNEICE